MGVPYPLLLLLLLGTNGLQAAAPEAPPPGQSRTQQEWLAAGKAIYLFGELPDGGSISARVRGDVPLSGSRYACVNCHRRSGIGSSEGGEPVPAIISEVLFAPRIATLHGSYPSGGMHRETRPAYTTASLGQALTQGVDPAGRELSPLMPRFDFSDSEVRALSTYLASLTVTTPPGVDEQEIHFATITTPGNEAAREAMLEVLTAYFRDKNAGTRGETRRAENAPFHKAWVYGSYRRWKLHEWALHGPQQEWPEQLQALYAKQPVFAVVGGVGSDGWQPVHRFCEAQQLPCLMPHIPLPPGLADQDFYSLYFSRGVELEAQTLARHLGDAAVRPRQVIQVRDERPAAVAAAQSLRHALSGPEAPALTEIVLQPGQIPGAGFWRGLAEKHGDAVWVLWLDAQRLEGLAALAGSPTLPAAIYLSASLQPALAALQQHPLHQRFTLLTPYRADDTDRRTLRFRTWARLRKLPVSDLHLQSSSFLTVSLVGEALMHLRGNLSREYFLERIEHMMDNMINPSLYPRISLAPGQRFAAKGCYVWEMGKGFDTAQWIVP
jgi:hypothetical protein